MMNDYETREYWRASRLLVLSFLLWLGGCSFQHLSPPPSDDTVHDPAMPSSVFSWEVITGAVEENPITGVIDNRFVRPVAVTTHNKKMFIVDAGSDLLYLYNRDFQTLSILKDLKTVVTGEVTDIYVSPDLSYYLADADASRVLHFDREGRLLHVYQDRINLGRPVAVQVDESNGYVFIADGYNDDVLVYSPANELVTAIGARGSDPGQFRGITSLALGPEGYYVATRFGEHRVQIMGHDGAYAGALQKDTVTFPLAVTVDRSGRVFVSDYLDNTIKVYADHKLVETIGGTGSAPGRFKRITDLWLDDNLLYAVDSLNARIQVLRLSGPAAAQ